MAEQKQLNVILIVRNNSTTEWESSSYCLKKGELGIGYLDNGNVIVKSGVDGKTSWANCPQVEGVFEDDLVLTYDFGRFKTQNGSVNAGGKGMTTSGWLLDALSEVLNPKTNYPSVSLGGSVYIGSNSSTSSTCEIGSYITKLRWDGTFNSGSYKDVNNSGTYGTSNSATSNATGLSAANVTWSVSNNKDAQTGATEDGSFALVSEDYIRVDTEGAKNYATITAVATLDASGAYTPLNNVGQQYAAGKIAGFDAAGTKTKTLTANCGISGYRNSWYYVGDDCTSEVNSAFIRSTTGKGSNTKNFGTLTIGAGTKRVMIAVPGTATLKSVIDVDGMGLDVKENFEKKTVNVEGANGYTAAAYTVFVCDNPNGLAATKYTFSIG